mgnify:CR=1 FL=1
MPISFSHTPEGVLFAANGMGPMLKWDGLTDEAERVGLAGPEAKPFMSSSGAGNILGTFFANLRYIDRNGNPSNLSPVSPLFTPISAAGALSATSTANSNVVAATPTSIRVGEFTIVIEDDTTNVTAVAHGLPARTFQYVQIASVGGTTEVNGITQVIVLDADTVNLAVKFANNYTSGGTLTQLGSVMDRIPVLITRYSCPLPVHMAWALWCSENVTDDDE